MLGRQHEHGSIEATTMITKSSPLHCFLMKYEHLPNRKYGTLCAAMEAEGWVSHSIACCLGKYGRGERLPTCLKRSKTFAAYKAGKKPPVFDDSAAVDRFLVFRDVNGSHPGSVRVNYEQKLVRSVNGSNQQFSVGYLDDLESDIETRLAPRLRK